MCDEGMTFAVRADRAGAPKVLVNPKIPTIEYICHGCKLSVTNKTVANPIKKKLKD